MRGNRSYICLGGIVLMVLLVGADCRAEFSLHPGIYTRLEVTDNLFLTETNKNSEMIATIAPTLWLEQTGKLLNLEIEYAYEMYRFLNQPELNDRIDGHFGRLDGTFFPERNFFVLLHGEVGRENLDRRRSDSVALPTVNTTNRYLGLIRPTYRFDLGSRHSGEMAYVYEVIKYDRAQTDDTQSHRAELMLERNQSARLDFRLTGFYEQLTAKISPDYDRLQGMAGGEWRPFTSATLTAMGGVSWFEYETGENFNSRVLDCRLLYVPSRRWSLDASYVENFEYDVLYGLFKTWRGEGGLSYTGRLTWRLSMFFRNDDYVRVIREDSEQGFVGVATYQMTQRVALGVHGDIRSLKFEPLTENVDRRSAGVSIEYTPRDFVTMGCRYTYRNSDSDIDGRDYIENRADCDLRLSYPLIP